MKTSIFLLPAFLRVAVAEIYPYFKSAAFDRGKYGPYPNRSYITEPDLVSPRLNILQTSPRCDDGLYTMISLRGDEVEVEGQSPMIFDNRGNLVYMNATYGETFGLGVQSYRGQDYLTFWQGDDSVGGHGEGYYFLLDSSYREAYRLSAGGGLPGDLHEFRITEQGTALITVYPMKEYDLPYNPDHLRTKGYIWDSVFQEVDIESNKILFEWRASDYYNISESDYPAGRAGHTNKYAYDFFHINSVDKDHLGNYLISSRYMQGLTYIDGKNGDILWVLGGKRNSFRDISGGEATKFSWQHDARWTADHSGVHLFDNGARYGTKPKVDHSRGITVNLDLEKMTAELKDVYVNPRRIISASQGSMQILPSGNVLLGYGYNAAWTEFSAEGEPLCDVHIGSQKTFNTGAVQTYKVQKYAWVGNPLTLPEIQVVDDEVYLSWNGATEVKRWRLEGASRWGARLETIEEVEKRSFETSVPIDDTAWCFVRARALDVNGKILGTSELVGLYCEIQKDLEAQAMELAWLWESSEGLFFKGFQLVVIAITSITMWELWRRRIAKRTYYTVAHRLWSDE